MGDIFEALESGDAERVREVVSRDPSAATARGPDGLSAVMWARYRDRLDLLDALLEANPELDVFEAAAVGRVDRLLDLVDGDAGLVSAWSPDGFTPLHLAVFFGHTDAAGLLLDRGADVGAVSRNGLGVAPLNSAAAAGHASCVELLLGRGAEVDSTGAFGGTPLHAAAENGDAATAAILLRHGADPSPRTPDGKTPRDLALAKGHPEVVELLPAG